MSESNVLRRTPFMILKTTIVDFILFYLFLFPLSVYGIRSYKPLEHGHFALPHHS